MAAAAAAADATNPETPDLPRREPPGVTMYTPRDRTTRSRGSRVPGDPCRRLTPGSHRLPQGADVHP